MGGMSEPAIHPLTAYRRRPDVNLRQAAFAKLAGTTKATISRIEAGALSPSPALMQRLVAATGGQVTAAMLVCGDTREIVELVIGKKLPTPKSEAPPP
jgi:transcriptional regulator with XRE-family HTH domain